MGATDVLALYTGTRDPRQQVCTLGRGAEGGGHPGATLLAGQSAVPRAAGGTAPVRSPFGGTLGGQAQKAASHCPAWVKRGPDAGRGPIWASGFAGA